VVDPAIAGLKRGENAERELLLSLVPRIQIVTGAFLGKLPDAV
jgi:hypothetical protein